MSTLKRQHTLETRRPPAAGPPEPRAPRPAAEPLPPCPRAAQLTADANGGWKSVAQHTAMLPPLFDLKLTQVHGPQVCLLEPADAAVPSAARLWVTVLQAGTLTSMARRCILRCSRADQLRSQASLRSCLACRRGWEQRVNPRELQLMFCWVHTDACTAMAGTQVSCPKAGFGVWALLHWTKILSDGYCRMIPLLLCVWGCVCSAERACSCMKSRPCSSWRVAAAARNSSVSSSCANSR
jgi:hypothetical protein